jgi:hypothetical protein
MDVGNRNPAHALPHFPGRILMNAKECNLRASGCAANAAIAIDESVSLEFLRMAAHWRAMAVRQIFIGPFPDPAVEQSFSNAIALPAK